MNLEAQEQDRVIAARVAISRFLPLLTKLNAMRQSGKLETQDGGAIEPVRTALLRAREDIGKVHSDRQYAYGLLVGCHSILFAVIPGSTLCEGLELACDKLAGIVNTDSSVWIEAQEPEIDDICEILQRVIDGQNVQAKAA